MVGNRQHARGIGPRIESCAVHYDAARNAVAWNVR
jgi:hypothetical protein